VYTSFGLFVSILAENNNSKVRSFLVFILCDYLLLFSQRTDVLHHFFRLYFSMPDSTSVPFCQFSSFDLSFLELEISSWMVASEASIDVFFGTLSFLLDYQKYLVEISKETLSNEGNWVTVEDRLSEWSVFASSVGHQLFPSPDILFKSFRIPISGRQWELFLSFSSLCIEDFTIDGGSLHALVLMYFSPSTENNSRNSISSLLLKYLSSLDENNMLAVLSVLQLILDHLCLHFLVYPSIVIDLLDLFLENILFLRRKLFRHVLNNSDEDEQEEDKSHDFLVEDLAYLDDFPIFEVVYLDNQKHIFLVKHFQQEIFLSFFHEYYCSHKKSQLFSAINEFKEILFSCYSCRPFSLSLSSSTTTSSFHLLDYLMNSLSVLPQAISGK
jgi:hypothetical protein